MKRLDRLILGEIIGPFLFGTALFTVLILAGQFLFQFTGYVSRGIPLTTIAWLFILNLPGVFVLTFPMATLLSMLLGFGRLSSDSELTAVKASGASLLRVMAPVAGFGTVVAMATFYASEYVVPRASQQAESLMREIAQKLEQRSDQPTSFPIYNRDGKLTAQVMARAFDLGQRRLKGVTIAAFDEASKPSFYLTADTLLYKDDEKWSIEGPAELVSRTGDYHAEITDGLWPQAVPQPDNTPEEIRAQSLKKLDAQSMEQLSAALRRARANPGTISVSQMRNLEYGYWNKVAIPLAALVYALVGAPLGVRNHRSNSAAGYWMAIMIIFFYFLLTNVMGIASQGGAFPPAVAAFTPIVIGLAVGIGAVIIKNR